MKTLFINCSPKKRFSASAYFLSLQRLFVKGEKATEKLRNRKDHARILEELRNADSVVFCLPLYVDGVPSHVLRFLKEAEAFCRENSLHPNLFCIANNGFIEGCQNEPLLQVLENFCERAGLSWRGGVGIGGGVMLNVTRILFAVLISLLLMQVLMSGIQYGNFFPAGALRSFAGNVTILLFLNMGVLLFLIRMGRAINRGAFFGKHYTRILLPSFVFILFADAFFVVTSTFQGGLFKGWLAKKDT